MDSESRWRWLQRAFLSQQEWAPLDTKRGGSISATKKLEIVGAKKVSYKADKSFGVFRGDKFHDRSLQISDWKTICEEIQVALKGAKMEQVKYHWTMVGGRVSQWILGNVIQIHCITCISDIMGYKKKSGLLVKLNKILFMKMFLVPKNLHSLSKYFGSWFWGKRQQANSCNCKLCLISSTVHDTRDPPMEALQSSSSSQLPLEGIISGIC